MENHMTDGAPFAARFSFEDHDHRVLKYDSDRDLSRWQQALRATAWRHVVGEMTEASVSQVDRMIEYLESEHGSHKAAGAIASFTAAKATHGTLCGCEHELLGEFAIRTALSLVGRARGEEGCWAVVEDGNLTFSGHKANPLWLYDSAEPRPVSPVRVTYDPQTGVGTVEGPHGLSRTLYRVRHPNAQLLVRRAYEERAIRELMGLNTQVLDLVGAILASNAKVSRREFSPLAAVEWNMYRLIRAAEAILEARPRNQVALAMLMLPTWDGALDDLLDSVESATS
jgi:hypothetical protein